MTEKAYICIIFEPLFCVENLVYVSYKNDFNE